MIVAAVICFFLVFIFRPGLVKVDRGNLLEVLTEEIEFGSLKVVSSYGENLILLNSRQLQEDFVDVIKKGDVRSLADRLPIGPEVQDIMVEGKKITLSIRVYPHLHKAGYCFVIQVWGELKGHINIVTADTFL